MSKVITVSYKGNFQTEIKAGKQKILTDRKGEILSPSELTAAAVTSCAMTVLSIVIENENMNFEDSYVEVEKQTDLTVYRITEIKLVFHLRKEYSEEIRKKAETAVKEMCVVGRSLSSDITQNYTFIYDVE
ncbi:OsmC family peroxiredoxin [Leptotrichia sp. OH3620_COT-345]|uniref:OsmC family protein n=1 Tax=Leptotrichia sp. OH3620_COT-345 TaxID=2491048 RepID=UPI000F653CBC|nr:OsmC family protein [Leptotrichia sp. OH3620_COT-345]RRD40946.1 OsmC family peroxiredoxin [Leptotrichia sp. OH3620_COT-345]